MSAPLEEFDHYATQYDQALQLGLSITGESKDYFLERRIDWVRHRWNQWRIDSLNCQPRSTRCASAGHSLRPAEACRILDFGCGTGASTPVLGRTFPNSLVVGVDSSQQSIEIARAQFASESCHFYPADELPELTNFELVYCNGVYHHIPVEQRLSITQEIYARMAPGGWFCLWENNPWNPGTRLVMRRIPFDRDANTLNFLNAKKLVRRAGFQVISVDFCLYFPRVLSALRFLEPYLVHVPLGAQYCVFAQKPRALV